MWGKLRHFLLLAAILVLVACARVWAARPASPDVEVKFFVNPSKVLDANRRPSQPLCMTLHLAPKPVAIRMEFLDGSEHELDREGWNIRFRKIQGQGHVELTFKRRYRVEGGLDATLAKAALEGFDAADNDFQPEVDWTYQTQTLTFANQKQAGFSGEQDFTLPSVSAARTFAENAMPGKLRRFKHEDWAKTVLAGGPLYGPADGSRWRGRYPGISDKIAVEVWELPASSQPRTQPVVEISFKVRKYDQEAITKRDKLLALLKNRGWLQEKDELKTERIIDGSLPPQGHRLFPHMGSIAGAIYSVRFCTTIMLRSVHGPMCLATLNSPLTVRNCPSCNAV